MEYGCIRKLSIANSESAGDGAAQVALNPSDANTLHWSGNRLVRGTVEAFVVGVVACTGRER